MSMNNGSTDRMESNVSLSDFTPFEDVEEVVPGDVSGLGKNGEKNSEGSDDAFQEEISPELTEGILSKDSQRIKCTALR